MDWNEETKYFYALTPEVIDQAIQTKGLRPIGRVLPLNSLENRVYEIEIDQTPLLTPPFSKDCVIAKFYRPGRWSKETILEEHQFLLELTELEIPVVAPLIIDNQTLFTCPTTNFLYALFPKMRGRLKDELNKEEITIIGRLAARIHNAGSNSSFSHRPLFHPMNYIDSHFEHLKKNTELPGHTVNNYLTLAKEMSTQIKPLFDSLKNQRIHGDLHRGNIIWSSDGPYIVDLDDSVMGPREQDLWPLIPGRDQYSKEEHKLFMEAYNEMARAPISISRYTIEALRSLRMIHFNGWIAKRWADPAFKKIYSHFDTENYWETQVIDLREQFAQLADAKEDDLNVGTELYPFE